MLKPKLKVGRMVVVVNKKIDADDNRFWTIDKVVYGTVSAIENDGARISYLIGDKWYEDEFGIEIYGYDEAEEKGFEPEKFFL